MATEQANKKAEREALRGVIQQWNANRLDLFELSEPNEVSIAQRQFLIVLKIFNCLNRQINMIRLKYFKKLNTSRTY